MNETPREIADERAAIKSLEEAKRDLTMLVYSLAQQGITFEGQWSVGGKSIVYRLTRRPFLRKSYMIECECDRQQLAAMR